MNITSDKKLIISDEKEFDYDHVYSENVTNSDIFNKSIQENIIKSLDGYNLSIMAYGQTVRKNIKLLDIKFPKFFLFLIINN